MKRVFTISAVLLSATVMIQSAVARDAPSLRSWTVLNSTGASHSVSPELKAEATTVLANILSAAKISGFTLVPGAMNSYHASWAAPGVVGGLRIENLDAAESTGFIFAVEEKNCGGSFGGARERSEGGAVTLRCACKVGSGQSTNVFYTIVPRPAGGSYVLFVTAVEDRSTSSDVPPEDIAAKTGSLMLKASLRALATD